MNDDHSIDLLELLTERNVMCMLRNVLHLLNSFILLFIITMQRKDWKTSVKGYWIWGYRQLNKVDNLITKLEKANFVKRYFNRECLNLLKEQKKYLEKSISKEIELWMLKEDSKFSKPVDNIIKENKRLSKEIIKSSETNYLSKREANHWNQMRRRGRPRKVLS